MFSALNAPLYAGSDDRLRLSRPPTASATSEGQSATVPPDFGVFGDSLSRPASGRVEAAVPQATRLRVRASSRRPFRLGARRRRYQRKPARSRRREEADGLAAAPDPSPHVGGYDEPGLAVGSGTLKMGTMLESFGRTQPVREFPARIVPSLESLPSVRQLQSGGGKRMTARLHSRPFSSSKKNRKPTFDSTLSDQSGRFAFLTAP